MAYQSEHTGQNIDNAISNYPIIDNKILSLQDKNTLLENQIILLQDKNTQLQNSINELNNYIGSLKHSYYCYVYYSGSGDTSFTSNIKFNTIKFNEGNCYNTSTGYYTVPENGFYYVSFTYYTNNSSHQRPAILFSSQSMTMTNSISCTTGHTISTVRYLNTGDTIAAGAYHSSYPINLYAAQGHNDFIVFKIK